MCCVACSLICMQPASSPCEAANSSEVLRERFAAASDNIIALNAEIDAKLELLREREARWNRLMAEVEINASAAKTRVKLDVGGRIFSTTRDTLLRWGCTYFHALLGSNNWQPNEDGTHFIDRDSTMFDRIMECMRSGQPIDVDGLTPRELRLLRIEADYFQLPEEMLCNFVPLGMMAPISGYATPDPRGVGSKHTVAVLTTAQMSVLDVPA